MCVLLEQGPTKACLVHLTSRWVRKIPFWVNLMIQMNDKLDICSFANGIKIYRSDVSPEQAKRYKLTSPLFHEPTEEKWFERIFDYIERDVLSDSPPTFLDIGSALGYYSILFKHRFPEANLIAVDPNPHFQERMLETFRLNSLSADDYTKIPCAVFPYGDQVVFADRGFGSYISHGEAIGEGRTLDTIIVDVCRLRSIFDSVEGHIDLVKMDIQGAEQAIFNQNIDLVDSGKVRHWIIGTHGPNIHNSILDHLSRRHKIIYENATPKDQIDGIIVASFEI